MDVQPIESPSQPDPEAMVIAALTTREGNSRFVTELVRDVRKTTRDLDAARIDQALSALEAEGSVLVRDHYCADPHLEGVDLRIAGRVTTQGDGRDAISACVESIEARWQAWIADYLAEHRCT